MNNAVSFESLTRLIRNPWFIAAWLGLMIISYLWIDLPLAVFFQQHANSITVHIAQGVTQWGKSSFYLVALVGLFCFARWIKPMPHWQMRSVFLATCIALPGILCLLLKVLLGRARPIEWLQHGEYGFYWFKIQASFLSFPSGHTVTITGLMFGLCYLFPRYWTAWLIILITVAFSRVIVTAHYLSDIMAGMLLAVLTVMWLHQQWTRRKIMGYQ